MTTGTLTDEDGRTAQYTLTPNFGGMTMTVKTEQPKKKQLDFDATDFVSLLADSVDRDGKVIETPTQISRQHATLIVARAYWVGFENGKASPKAGE